MVTFSAWRHPPAMENSKGSGVWRQIVVRRCPYCVEGNDFRAMLELSGSPDGLFFCSRCHHLAGSVESEFKCECVKCRSMNTTQTTSLQS